MASTSILPTNNSSQVSSYVTNIPLGSNPNNNWVNFSNNNNCLKWLIQQEVERVTLERDKQDNEKRIGQLLADANNLASQARIANIFNLFSN